MIDDAELDDLPDRTPVVSALDDANGRMIGLIADDLASGIWPEPTIARRYGLTMPQLVELRDTPAIAMLIKTRRAVQESTAGLPERLRLKAGVGLDHVMAPFINMVTDPDVPNGIKVEVMKLLGKWSGADGGGQKNDDPGRFAGGQFAVNIYLSEGRTKSFTVRAEPQPATIEGEAA